MSGYSEKAVRAAYELELAERDLAFAVEHRNKAKAALDLADEMVSGAANRLESLIQPAPTAGQE